MTPAHRISTWDNAKAILMLLVVFGHFAEPFTAAGYPLIFRSIFLVLYTFHMPAFIFISGMFSKSTLQKESFAFAKLFPFVLLSFLLKAGYMLKDYFVSHKLSVFSISKFSNIVWFLLALFFFYGAMYLLKNVNPKAVLLGAVLLACLAGYDKRINDTFALSRVIVYFPFFALGYYTKEERLRRLLAPGRVKVIAALVLAGFCAACFFFVEPLYAFRPLITGRNPFYTLGDYHYFGGLLRLAFYGVCTAVMLAFFALVPSAPSKALSFVGKNTLSVYFWHLPLIELLFWSGLPYTVQAHARSFLFIPLLLVAAAALCALLSLPVFGLPLKAVKKICARLEKHG